MVFHRRWFFTGRVRRSPAWPALTGPARPLPALASAPWAVQALPRPTGSGFHCVSSFPFAVHQGPGDLYVFHGFPCFRGFCRFPWFPNACSGLCMPVQMYCTTFPYARDARGTSCTPSLRFGSMKTSDVSSGLSTTMHRDHDSQRHSSTFCGACSFLYIPDAFRSTCLPMLALSTCSGPTASPHAFLGSHRYTRPFAPFGWHCAILSGAAVHNRAFSAILQHIRALAAM